jgi:hypothetical protein
MATRYAVAPSDADWYYSATITRNVPGGTETDYVDGYASGERPTKHGYQEWAYRTAPLWRDEGWRVTGWTVQPTS